MVTRPGLETHHVFLDTEVYRSFGHDLAAKPLSALGKFASEKRVALYTTDITLQEIKRQIRDDAVRHAKSAQDLSRKTKRWEQLSGKAFSNASFDIDADSISDAAYSHFCEVLLEEWGCNELHANSVDTATIFQKYFAKQPPFEGVNSKEFPDAFAIETLINWCESQSIRMYVVTNDTAMRAAASATDALIPLSSVDELLERAASTDTPQATLVLEEIISRKRALKALEVEIGKRIGWLGAVYTGNLHEGEVTDVYVDGRINIRRFSVVSMSHQSIEAIIDASIPVVATVNYYDVSHAIYDSEDGVYIGAEAEDAEISDNANIKLFASFDRANGKLISMDFITRDIHIAEREDFYK